MIRLPLCATGSNSNKNIKLRAERSPSATMFLDFYPWLNIVTASSIDISPRTTNETNEPNAAVLTRPDRQSQITCSSKSTALKASDL